MVRTLLSCLLVASAGAGDWAPVPPEAGLEVRERAAPTDAELALQYAPTLYQDLNSRFPRSVADLPMRFDFDGNFDATDNWESLQNVIEWQKRVRIERRGSNPLGYNLGAAIYYSVVESDRYWFLTYSVFHPQDWSDDLFRTSGAEHENDMEGAILAVEKDGSRFGRLLALMTQAHHHFFLYAAQPGVVPDPRVPGRGTLLLDGSHPRLYSECEGHGLAAGREQSTVSYGRKWLLPQRMKKVHLGPGGPTKDFAAGDGLVFIPAASGEYAWDPALSRDASDPERRSVGYQLLPINELWDRRASPETMMRFGLFRGARFRGTVPVGFSFNDRRSGAANPPWGWGGSGLAAGEAFFDPAWSFSLLFDFSARPGGFEPGRYTRHPYLEDIGALQ